MTFCKWTFVFTPEAEKKFESLDKSTKTQINKKIVKMMQGRESVMAALCPLSYEFEGLYSLHVGNYRLICEIRETELVVLGVDVDHRRKIYGGH